jgi:hypothetical protein
VFFATLVIRTVADADAVDQTLNDRHSLLSGELFHSSRYA